MATAVDDELEKYAKPPAKESAGDDELEKYAQKPADQGTYEEETPVTEKDLPGSTPRLREAVKKGIAPLPPTTEFEKTHTPSPGDTGVWGRLKQYGGDIAGMVAGLPEAIVRSSPVITPGKIADIATSYAGRAVPNTGQEGLAGARSPLYNVLATGAQATGLANPETMEASAEHGDPMGVLTHMAAQATPVAVGAASELGRIPAVRNAVGRVIPRGAIHPIDALADRFATPAVAPGLSEAATANLEEPIARRGVEKVLRATGMPSGQPGLRESFSIAAPDLAEVERAQPLGESGTKGGVIRPDLRLRQTVENIDNRLDDIWKEERQPQIDRNAELPAISREQLLGDATPEQIKRIEKAFKMEIPDQINLADADKMLVKVNARLRRAEAMTPEARALALELSPDLQKFNEMKTELHQSIGGLLERVNEPGVKEFNRRYGALSEVRDALRNRMNPVEAERVLDSIRATGGLGRNVNLFERLHLKASPGRLAQKGLEDLSRSNLQIVPPAQRPPVAGLLPAIPEPLGNGPDVSGPTNLPVPEAHTVVPVPGGRFVRGLLPGPVPEPPPVAPPPVAGQFRIEPIGAPVDESILARRRGQVGTRGLLPAPGGEAPAVPATPPAVPPNFRIEPIGNVTDAARLGARGQGGVRIPDIRMLPERSVGGIVPRATLQPLPESSPAETTALPTVPRGGNAPVAEISPTEPRATSEGERAGLREGLPKTREATERALRSLREASAESPSRLQETAGGKTALPTAPSGAAREGGIEEPQEVKIKGITAEEPKAKGTKRAKLEPVEKRFSQQEIIDAEGLLASEAGASLAGERPGAYYDEAEAGDVRLRSRGAQTKGGDWRGVKSGRNMFPFLRDNPDINPSAIEKALRNKDSAAYNRLIEKAIDYNRRHDPAYDFLRSMEAEPAQEAETPKPAPEEAKAPIIPKIGETGVIPGMEQAVAEQKQGAAKVAGENLTAEANRPKDISAAAGRMETLSPLFRGTEASPQREIFGGAQEPKTPTRIPTTKAIVPPDIEPVLKESGWTYEGKNDLGMHTFREPGKNVELNLFDRDMNPQFVRRKIAEKERQYGEPKRWEGETAEGRADKELRQAEARHTEALKDFRAKKISDEEYLKVRKERDRLMKRWEAARGESSEEVPF